MVNPVLSAIVSLDTQKLAGIGYKLNDTLKVTK